MQPLLHLRVKRGPGREKPIPMFTTVLLEMPATPRLLRAYALRCAAVVATALLTASLLAAQPPVASASAGTRRATPHRPRAKSTRATAVPSQPATATPAAPAAPNWPVNDRPVPAAVTWDSHGLRIDAQNSSLQQILHDLSSASGVKVEGMGSDQRVFGVYGPGQARDILSQLLQGSGYNIMLIGDQGEGMPRLIVLSSRQTGNAPEVANRGAAESVDEDIPENDVEEQLPPVPVTARPGLGQGEPVRTPQQVMQEMQQRQQQMQRNSPPNQ